MPIQIFVDNDACPVREEAIRVATRYGLQLILVSNQGMRPLKLPNVKQVVVDSSFDAADHWIVEHISAGDIVVTTDIQLAARCLGKGARALNATGHVYTSHNIGSALSMRELNAYLREAGEIKGHNPAFSNKDRSNFLQELDKMVQKNI
ncbi:MAG: YaiI/YqxD family protein [Rickettsiales bacterium]|nr:YaiI/YqxD family protein [Rickettsiales bacterium]